MNLRISGPLKSSEMLSILINRPDIEDLVIEGYGFNVSEKNERSRFAQNQFNYDEDSLLIWFAEIDGVAIGYLTLNLMKSTDEKSFEYRYQQALKEHLPQITNRVEPGKLFGSIVDGITIKPEFRKQGIAKLLFQKALNDVDPYFLIGQTRTPEVLIIRSKVLEDKGYISFYCGKQISGFNLLKAPENLGKLLVKCYYQARVYAYESHSSGLIHYQKSRAIPPKVLENIEQYPKEIQEPLKLINQAAQERPDITALGSFISIKAELLS